MSATYIYIYIYFFNIQYIYIFFLAQSKYKKYLYHNTTHTHPETNLTQTPRACRRTLAHSIIHTQNIANGRPAHLWSQRPSRVAVEGKIKTKKRDPRRREKAPARRSSTGEAHTPPGHAPPAARSMPDGRSRPRPLEAAAAAACSSVARLQANGFPQRAVRQHHGLPRGTLRLSKQRCHRLSTRASLLATPP